ncbi:hypothetical protein K6V26_05525 [Parabacteroides goldsteinii]|uniref:hypothetical protein n=1 Tax=Parabacteroides goldsteinii TaxID=328812 RepID=UPI001CCF054F|nr:hypothetical protein [Parabacteroides goldsteinii]UBD75803.1 hypothetical protein K6V26_05525 [Parabacteroides goldsteinii]
MEATPIPQDCTLDTYLEIMNKDMTDFQNELRQERKKLSKNQFFIWFLDNNNILRTYIIAEDTLVLKTEEETRKAKISTYNKHVETMILFL